MAKKAIIMHSEDNVATVLEKVGKGEEIEFEKGFGDTELITAVTKIRFLHKVAIKDIPEGKAVIKYGQIIGRATQEIQKGTHVHTKNVKSWFYS